MGLFFLLDFLILGARMSQKIVVAYLVNNQLNNKLAAPIAEVIVVIEIINLTEGKLSKSGNCKANLRTCERLRVCLSL